MTGLLLRALWFPPPSKLEEKKNNKTKQNLDKLDNWQFIRGRI
jgi:hypothetical protein